MLLGKRRRPIPGGALAATLASGALLAAAVSLIAPTSAAALPDNRGWELVSPVDKNGGEIAGPGELAGGGVLQAAADGNTVTYGSATSFGAGAQGAPPASQYLGRRGAGGWSTENLTTPILSGTYGEDEGSPYRLFATDLGRGLLLNGKHCRGEGSSGCPVANPPLPGTDAPAGFQNYYLRESATGGFEALLGPAELAFTDLDASGFSVSFAGASPDLQHLALSTCAALTPDATEVPLGDGCDPDKPNLYLWSSGALTLINTTPGAILAAQGGAVSADGTRVYWNDLSSGFLYLRDGATTKQVDTATGGGGGFQAASAEGGVAFFTMSGHLWRYVAATDTATDLTPAGGVAGVLATSADATRAYFQDATALKLWNNGVTTTVAPGANASLPSNFPPTTGTARATSDATRLLFLSTAPLTGYNNANQKTGVPETEVFLYDAAADQLRCASCRPTGARPIGPSTIPGSIANGQGPTTNSYKPRVLSTDGRRVFFDTRDAIVASDTNNDLDVYQWEAGGTGSCAKAAGCIELISSGRSEEGASFVDASLDGASAFFLTDGSLVGSDPDSVDLYVARIGGGFPEPPIPIPCSGDSCQNLPSEPVDPALSTLFAGPGNPKVSYVKYRRRNHKPCRRAAKARKCQKQDRGAKSKGATKRGKAAKGGRR